MLRPTSRRPAHFGKRSASGRNRASRSTQRPGSVSGFTNPHRSSIANSRQRGSIWCAATKNPSAENERNPLYRVEHDQARVPFLDSIPFARRGGVRTPATGRVAAEERRNRRIRKL